jgi:hypothetical protein
MKTEQDRVEKISSWYLKDQLDFDKRLVRLRGGVFFEPLSNQQMQHQWTDEMVQGFMSWGRSSPSTQPNCTRFATCHDPNTDR